MGERVLPMLIVLGWTLASAVVTAEPAPEPSDDTPVDAASVEPDEARHDVDVARLDDATILARLDAPAYRDRQEMTRRLRASRSLSMQRIETLYAAAPGEEARHRLLDVARHHWLRAQRLERFESNQAAASEGAIGLPTVVLSADQLPQLGRSAVHVILTLPGFPAHEHLEPGDFIVAFDGTDLPPDADQSVFQNIVTQHPAGAPLGMTVLRDGESLELTIELASLESLQAIYSVAGPRLEPSLEIGWAEVRDRIVARGPEPVRLIAPAAAESDAPDPAPDDAAPDGSEPGDANPPPL